MYNFWHLWMHLELKIDPYILSFTVKRTVTVKKLIKVQDNSSINVEFVRQEMCYIL